MRQKDTTEYCPDCSAHMPMGVQESAAGYYIGRKCSQCGPWSRNSQEYWATYKEAVHAIETGYFTYRTDF